MKALWLSLLLSLGCRSEPAGTKYVRSGDGFLMVLREGDDAFAHFRQLALSEKIRGATFEGFGFGHAKFGYFDQQKKAYDELEVRDVELASLRGSIAWQEGAPSLHAHAVATDRSFVARGGHLLGFQVGKGSLELEITLQHVSLERARDEALGANVLVLPR